VNWEFELAPQLGGIRLGPDARRHLLLFFKEAINNVERHAECSSVSLKITIGRNELRAQVRDNGRGFIAPAAERSADSNEGHGLKNMRERAAQLGGSLTIHSLPGVGTTLELTVPLRKP
jgi:signal transduction histidine kinase